MGKLLFYTYDAILILPFSPNGKADVGGTPAITLCLLEAQIIYKSSSRELYAFLHLNQAGWKIAAHKFLTPIKYSGVILRANLYD